MKQSIAILLFLALPGVALATWQEGDVLKYDGKTYYTPVFPLENCKTLAKGTYEFQPKLSSNMRAYVAMWEVRNFKLYLVDIGGEGSNLSEMIPHEWATPQRLSPEEVKDGRVHAAWFTGTIFSPGRSWGTILSDKARAEQERNADFVIHVKAGMVTRIENRKRGREGE